MNPVEEKLYEIAGQEIVSKSPKLGLWTKAFSTAKGDEQRAKAEYIELRVAQLRREFAAEAARQNESELECRNNEDARIRKRFSKFKGLPQLDADSIPRSQFEGNPGQLRYPVSALRVADVIGLLHFEVADLIKRGMIEGVYHDGDWYCELEEPV